MRLLNFCRDLLGMEPVYGGKQGLRGAGEVCFYGDIPGLQ